MFLKFKQFIIISSSLVQAMKSPRLSEPQIMIENLIPHFKAKDYRQWIKLIRVQKFQIKKEQNM